MGLSTVAQPALSLGFKLPFLPSQSPTIPANPTPQVHRGSMSLDRPTESFLTGKIRTLIGGFQVPDLACLAGHSGG